MLSTYAASLLLLLLLLMMMMSLLPFWQHAYSSCFAKQPHGQVDALLRLRTMLVLQNGSPLCQMSRHC
jgi:hypothetical protein